MLNRGHSSPGQAESVVEMLKKAPADGSFYVDLLRNRVNPGVETLVLLDAWDTEVSKRHVFFGSIGLFSRTYNLTL